MIPSFSKLLRAAVMSLAALALPAVLLHASAGAAAEPAFAPLSALSLKSSAALVMDQQSGETLYGKNIDVVHPMASITKLMTAMVTLDANLDPNEVISVADEDVDVLRNSSSRLRVGASATREEMLRLALMASENRAASALARTYPGGRANFIVAMNRKAQMLGLAGTHYDDPTGLSSTNVSTAEDLGRLVRAAHQYDKIREFTTTARYVATVSGRPMQFHNTNRLVDSPGWDIGLSKTGFINEAGRCLVMQAKLAGRAVVIVLLDSFGTYTRVADATRIRNWLEVASGYANPVRVAGGGSHPRAAHASVRPVAMRVSSRRTVAHVHSTRRHLTVAPSARRPA